jgi:rod shape-determining protein MreC
MFRLLSFLSTYRNSILFLVLECFSLWLVVKFNEHQRHLMGDIVLEVAGAVQDNKRSLTSYFDLRKTVDQLKGGIDSLQNREDMLERQLDELKAIMLRDSLLEHMPDSTIMKTSYHYIPARAVQSTTSKNYNYITLDKGKKDGITIGMGVVSPQGIAGRVIQTSPGFSLALSAINVSFKLSVKAEGIGEIGLYEWEGGDSRYGMIHHIPPTVELKPGDRVLTSGNSTVFPEGYQVGLIQSVNTEAQGGSQTAVVQLATNFRALRMLYIVQEGHREEIESMKKDLPQE